jgi:hypothetical protein
MGSSDLKLIEPLFTLLSVLAKSSKGSKNERLGAMYRSCMELFEQARVAVKSANASEIRSQQCLMSFPCQETENMEDFLSRMEQASSGYGMGLDSISPEPARDFAYAVEQQFQDTVIMPV